MMTRTTGRGRTADILTGCFLGLLVVMAAVGWVNAYAYSRPGVVPSSVSFGTTVTIKGSALGTCGDSRTDSAFRSCLTASGPSVHDGIGYAGRSRSVLPMSHADWGIEWTGETRSDRVVTISPGVQNGIIRDMRSTLQAIANDEGDTCTGQRCLAAIGRSRVPTRLIPSTKAG